MDQEMYKMEKWEMFKTIVMICHEHDGIIFGGAVRDSYLHKFNVRRYEQGPGEFADRFVVPNDVDCLIRTSQLPHLISTLQRAYYVRAYSSEHYGYYMDLPAGYKFQHYSLLKLSGNAPPMILGIDFLTQADGAELVIPVLPNDMDVNLLMWDKRQIYVNPTARTLLLKMFGSNDDYDDLQSMGDVLNLNSILKHIVTKQAICMSTCESHRIRKMIAYGWKLQYCYETITITDDAYEGVCVLCQDTIVGPHTSFMCGCARICMSCLRIHYSSLSKCTICKNTVDSDKLENDLRIYHAIHVTPIVESE